MIFLCSVLLRRPELTGVSVGSATAANVFRMGLLRLDTVAAGRSLGVAETARVRRRPPPRLEVEGGGSSAAD